MAVTIREIAQECGVSRQAVSYALSNRGRLSDQTRDQIIRTCRKLGYRPNNSAKMMRTGRFKSLGLLLSDIPGRGFIFDRTIAAIRAALREHEMHLTLGDLPDERLTSEQDMPKILREWFVDGLLVSYTHTIPDRMRQLIDDYQIPSVWLNAKLDVDCVYPDDVAGAREATQRLIDAGHKRVAWAYYGRWRHHSAFDRRDGYRSAIEAAGLSPRLLADENRGIERHRMLEASQAWLSGADRPTAIAASGPREALTLITAACRLGLRVPEDLSIVAIHDALIDDLGLAVATMKLPAESMGRAAVDMALNKINHPDQTQRARCLPLKYIDGATVAPPTLHH